MRPPWSFDSLARRIRDRKGPSWRAGWSSAIRIPNYGAQIQNRAVPRIQAEGKIGIEYTERPFVLANGTTVSLRHPHYSLTDLRFGPPSEDTTLSPRIAPPMIGLGLIEAIHPADIAANADPEDLDGDGISGRVPRVSDPLTGQPVLGRFGWKASQPSLKAQNAAAFSDDIGISTPLRPAATGDCTDRQTACLDLPDGVQRRLGATETPDPILDLVTFYAARLAAPRCRRPAGAARQIPLLRCRLHRFLRCRLHRLSPAEIRYPPGYRRPGADVPADLALFRPAVARYGSGTRRRAGGWAMPAAANGGRPRSGVSASPKPSMATPFSCMTDAPATSRKPSFGTAARQSGPETGLRPCWLATGKPSSPFSSHSEPGTVRDSKRLSLSLEKTIIGANSTPNLEIGGLASCTQRPAGNTGHPPVPGAPHLRNEILYEQIAQRTAALGPRKRLPTPRPRRGPVAVVSGDTCTGIDHERFARHRTQIGAGRIGRQHWVRT